VRDHVPTLGAGSVADALRERNLHRIEALGEFRFWPVSFGSKRLSPIARFQRIQA
jgi:hypothetical protein